MSRGAVLIDILAGLMAPLTSQPLLLPPVLHCWVMTNELKVAERHEYDSIDEVASLRKYARTHNQEA